MDKDRRQYFRVNDSAYIEAAPFDPEHPSIPDYFPQLHQIAVMKEFAHVDQQFREFLDRVKDASTRKLLSLFNEKIDLISRHLHIQDLQEHSLSAQTIDISEGGCAVTLPGDHSVDQELALVIIFTPSYLSLFLRARVAEAEPVDQGTRVHLSFVAMSEAQRQALTRHMFKVQAENR